MIATCPTHEKLQSLSLGKLEESESDELVLHLQHCESCRSQIQEIDTADDTFVSNLRDAARETDDFSGEAGFRLAATRALASLANANEGSMPRSVGEYEIVKSLGHGGMGQVFLARHTKLERKVAIKVLADHRRWDQTMQERFASEMRAVGGLNHPNIVVAHDAREVDGLAVLVTEYIEGMDLGAILRREGTLSVANACKIVGEVCSALEYCQTKGLVHRDVKPSNIMIDIEGNVKLLDLGLARLHDPEQPEFTATGHAIGTVDYVAPEQINDSRNVDARTDLYSLGCAFFKLLTGRPPFLTSEYASPFAKMNAHVSELAPRLSTLQADVPRELDVLVARMLEKSPADRPGSAAEVRNVVARFSGEADLQDLVRSAQAKPVLQLPVDGSLQPAAALAKPQASSSRFSGSRWIRWVCAFGALGLAGLFGFWMGVIITIKKPDGTKTQIEIPDGSTAVVDADGNVEITIAGTGQKLKVPPASKAPSSPIAVCGIRLLKNHPLHGCLEPGDEVDVVFDDIENKNALDRLFASGKKVLKIEKDGEDEIVDIEVDAWRYSHACGNAKATEATTIVLHDPDRQIRHDEEKMNGVWKVVRMEAGGKSYPGQKPSAILMYNGKSIQFGSGGPHVTTYSLLANGGIIGKLADSEEQDSYRFLPSGRLEFASTDPEKTNQDSTSIKPTDYLLRLARVETPETEAQRDAFEVLRSAKTGRRKIAIRILNDKKEPLEGSPIIVSNENFLSANAIEQNGRWTINFRLNAVGSRRMKHFTSTSIGKLMGIFIDDELICSPKINGAIGGGGVIEGDFTKEEVESIVEGIVPKLMFRGKELKLTDAKPTVPDPSTFDAPRDPNGVPVKPIQPLKDDPLKDEQ